MRFLEFFAVQIRNAHTRRAYAQATREFLDWCESSGVASIADVTPLRTAPFVEQLTKTHSGLRGASPHSWSQSQNAYRAPKIQTESDAPGGA